MKVKERLTNLFKTMDELQQQQLGHVIFNFVDSDLLDKYYINMYGNREVAEIVENLTLNELASILNNKFSSKWDNIILNYLDSENLLSNYKETIQEITTNNMNTNNTRTDTNRVSAYNDENFINNDENTTIENITTGNNGNKEIIRTKIKDAEFYEKVNRYLTNFDIYSIMIKDINTIITLNILN